MKKRHSHKSIKRLLVLSLLIPLLAGCSTFQTSSNTESLQLMRALNDKIERVSDKVDKLEAENKKNKRRNNGPIDLETSGSNSLNNAQAEFILMMMKYLE